MTDSNAPLNSDFAGFLDGFQARNLASIQRTIALQLSEMQARLAVLRTQIQSGGAQVSALTLSLSLIDEDLIERSGTIIDRLVKVGEHLTELLIQQGQLLKRNAHIFLQIKGFLLAYVDAAEVSRNNRLIDAAIHVADAYRETESISV